MVTRPASSPAAWGSATQGSVGLVGGDARLHGAPPPTPLLPLRDIVQSLREAERGVPPQGRARQRLRGQVRAIGVAVFPALLRALRSDHAGLVDWACDLLSSVADSQLPELCTRLDGILVDPRVHDATKARILGLLSDLQAPLPEHVLLKDPDAMIRGSVHDLIADLSSEQAVEQALDLLYSQVPAHDLSRFLAEVMNHGGGAAQPFLSAVVADPRTPRPIALELAHHVRPLLRQSLGPAARKSQARRSPDDELPISDYRQALAGCRHYLQAAAPHRASEQSANQADLSIHLSIDSSRSADLAARCFAALRWQHEASLHRNGGSRAALPFAPTRMLAFGQ